MEIRNNRKLALIFMDIELLKKSMYYYAWVKNQCNNDYDYPVDMFWNNRHEEYPTLEAAQHKLDFWRKRIDKLIHKAIENLGDRKNKLIDADGEWRLIAPLGMNFHEVPVPSALEDILDSVIKLMEIEPGDYNVRYDNLNITIPVANESIINDLATIISISGYYSSEDTSSYEIEGTVRSSGKYGIILIEKPVCSGLTANEIIKMCNYFDGEVYPIEIESRYQECSAMGFITNDAANILDYNYKDSGLNDFISVILDNIDNESTTGNYTFREIPIKFLKNI